MDSFSNKNQINFSPQIKTLSKPKIQAQGFILSQFLTAKKIINLTRCILLFWQQILS